MAEHTPGPWFVASRSAGAHVNADKSEVAWLRSYMGVQDEQIEANARLIAAAPDLLAALKLAKDHSELEDEVLDIVDAAISKATA